MLQVTCSVPVLFVGLNAFITQQTMRSTCCLLISRPAAFVDLRAAFDSLSRRALWLFLTRLGIPDKIVRLFRVLYDNSVSCVRTSGTHSSWFKIEAGVRQGCVLAPDSFATGMDWLLEPGQDC